MVDILAGAKVASGYWIASQEAFEDTEINAAAQGTWGSGAPAVNTTFVAPKSGKVLVTVSALVRHNVAGGQTQPVVFVVSFRLHQGSSSAGTEIASASTISRAVRYQVFTDSPGLIGGNPHVTTVGTLTPGTQYWVEWQGQQATIGAGASVFIRARKLVVASAT